MFKTYSIINTIAVLAAFACAAALTVVAGLKHQTSSVACQRVSLSSFLHLYHAFTFIHPVLSLSHLERR